MFQTSAKRNITAQENIMILSNITFHNSICKQHLICLVSTRCLFVFLLSNNFKFRGMFPTCKICTLHWIHHSNKLHFFVFVKGDSHFEQLGPSPNKQNYANANEYTQRQDHLCFFFDTQRFSSLFVVWKHCFFHGSLYSISQITQRPGDPYSFWLKSFVSNKRARSTKPTTKFEFVWTALEYGWRDG